MAEITSTGKPLGIVAAVKKCGDNYAMELPSNMLKYKCSVWRSGTFANQYDIHDKIRMAKNMGFAVRSVTKDRY